MSPLQFSAMLFCWEKVMVVNICFIGGTLVYALEGYLRVLQSERDVLVTHY